MNRNGVEFLSPNTISCLIVLREYTNRHQNELDPSNPFANFLINKIMKLNEEEEADSSLQFLKRMIKESQNFDISEQYRIQVEKIQSLHDLFNYLLITLKDLRTSRCNRMEQGNVIDMFLRRCHLNFGKCGFSDMVKLYQNFADYKNDSYKHRKHATPNTYLADKKLDDLHTKILNFDNCYSYEEINKQIEALEHNSKSNHDKVSFLKAHNEAKNQHPLAALASMHKYFDKQLEMLFYSEKTNEGQPTGAHQSKVNQCILNVGFLNLEMGLVDECLRSLSEAMRMSQNNQDAESINNCILQLQEIAVSVRKPSEALSLIEHALSHALNLTHNPLLLLYATLSYAKFTKHYDTASIGSEGLHASPADAAQQSPYESGLSGSLQSKQQQHRNKFVTQQNLKWVELMHYSFRKILVNYENYLIPGRKKSKQQLLHLPRSLEFMVKALIFDTQSQPALVDLLVNNVYEATPQVLTANKNFTLLFDIAIKQVISSNSQHDSDIKIFTRSQLMKNIRKKAVDWDLEKSVQLFQRLFEMMNNLTKPYFEFQLYYSNAKMFIHRMELSSARCMYELMQRVFQSSLIDPLLNSKLQQIHVEILLKENKHSEAYEVILSNIQFNQESGFEKELLIQAHIYLVSLKFANKDFFAALPIVQNVLKLSKLHGLREHYAIGKLYKVLIYAHLGYIRATLKIVKNIEERWLMNFSSKTQAFLYYVKAVVMLLISSSCPTTAAAAAPDQNNSESHIQSHVTEEIRKNVHSSLNRSLELYLNLNCLTEIRDIYYLQARLYDEQGLIAHREAAAYFFVAADEAINANSASTYISTYHIRDLSLYRIQLALSTKFKSIFKIVVPPTATVASLPGNNEKPASSSKLFSMQ